jgi:hypothetical protein
MPASSHMADGIRQISRGIGYAADRRRTSGCRCSVIEHANIFLCPRRIKTGVSIVSVYIILITEDKGDWKEMSCWWGYNYAVWERNFRFLALDETKNYGASSPHEAIVKRFPTLTFCRQPVWRYCSHIVQAHVLKEI